MAPPALLLLAASVVAGLLVSVSADPVPMPAAEAGKPPLILIPGFTGCSLEAKLARKKSSFPQCPADTEDYEVMWLEQNNFEGPNAFCFLENMEVQVAGNHFRSYPGVDVRPRDFGGVEGLMYQDLERRIPSFYKNVVEYLERNGWKVGTTLWGAPYDWRTAGDRYDTYFADLKALVEKAHETTGQRVNLFAHSMGPSVALTFLQMQTQDWKDRHIGSFMPVVPVWSGNIVSVWNTVSGLDCKAAWGGDCPGGEGALGKYFLREIGTNLPSSYWTFPTPGAGSNDGTWDREEVIIQAGKKDYTAYDTAAMLEDLGLDRAVKMHNLVANSPTKKFDAPLVDTYVFYGYGVKTPSRFNYAAEFVPTAPGEAPPTASKVVYNASDAGDGVVALRCALRSEKAWQDPQAAAGKKLEHKGYRGMQHADTKTALPDIVKLLNEQQQQRNPGVRAAGERVQPATVFSRE